jgi:hypothetical protein
LRIKKARPVQELIQYIARTGDHCVRSGMSQNNDLDLPKRFCYYLLQDLELEGHRPLFINIYTASQYCSVRMCAIEVSINTKKLISKIGESMRLRVVSSKNEIPNLNPNEKMIHLAFRASNVDFLNLMQRCPRLRMIQVPPSYRKTMSNAIQVFLDMQGIELLEGDVWGHRKDLDEYFTVDDATLEEIRSLAASGAAMDDVANQIQKKARLGQDLIKYIAKSKTAV